MSETRTGKSWTLPAAIGILLVGLFAILLTISSTLQHYWPLLIIAATAAAAPFLIREPVTPRRRPLPIFTPRTAADETLGSPTLSASSVTVPKASSTGGENEDAHAIDLDSGYLAVADGASSSFRAAEWSQFLCEAFTQEQPLGTMPSQTWITNATVKFRESAPDDSDWWSNEAAERGAHAAFAGLAILRHEQRLSWRATAIGDCVLVHLRPVLTGQPPIVTAFPIAHSASFPQNPSLLSSASDGHPPVSYIEGSAQLGDTWLLMTDELARWAMRRYESGDPVWTLLSCGTDVDLTSAIAVARESGHIADDDMTIVRCEVVAGQY
ncbi:hypothetical protein [Pseudonocardia sp. GCM10023141]|uniref:hypothetical protein n=1 Tax=Pseudonocardia sp. GCM10023141 TaxID=3252653 RepID=UPI003610ECE0